MLGVTDTQADKEGQGGFANQSSRVQAVGAFDGIADFRTNYADALMSWKRYMASFLWTIRFILNSVRSPT